VCVRSVVKSDVYLESEASSPLHRRALVIIVSRLCGVWLGVGKDTCTKIRARGLTSVWHGAHKLACSFDCGALRRCILGNVSTCGWPCDRSRTVAPQAVDAFMAQGL